MNKRDYTPLDRGIIELEHAAKVVVGTPSGAQRDYPAQAIPEAQLSEGAQRLAARLMRVNNAGEVSAQALYRGQACVAKTTSTRDRLLRAADEEHDHLSWCSQRLAELGSQRSRFDGFWYLGSFAIGALAGIAGDRWSLGFVAETEKQVENHLDDHLQRLDADDRRSRRVLETMREDEIEHGRAAMQAGGRSLPQPVRRIMGFTSKVMTTLAYWG